MARTIAAPAVGHLVDLGRSLSSADRGGKTAMVAALSASMGMSRATVYRHLKTTVVQTARRQRSDKGDTTVTLQEAQLISALVMESSRKNGKRLMTVQDALRVLRYDALVRCERLDAKTGELVPLSASAVERALGLYGLHPRQLLQPKPSVELQSLHPNHAWQIDASLCVLYYLQARSSRESGLQVLDADKFYKNKPAALKRVESERVWRYVVTDHYSGSLFVHYVLGAESGVNLTDSFISAITPRADGDQVDPFHGVPLILMMDMGSANTSGMFKNFARRLDVKLIAHAPGNARATGQVEKAQDLVERYFESALKLQPVADLDELNLHARYWQRDFNATAIHTRHGRTRTDIWLTISAEQLRLAPDPQLCRELVTHQPEERKVRNTLSVEFRGREYDVRDVPGVMVGEKLRVAINPYQIDAASIVLTDEQGNEAMHLAPEIGRNIAGFREDANVIDEDWARPADTRADTNRKAQERFVMDAATDIEAVQARKAKTTPFGGRIDPLKQARERVLPTPIPKRGTELPITVTLPQVATQRLNLFQAMSLLAQRGVDVATHRAWVADRYADGVPEDELDALTARLQAGAALRVVAGGGA